MRAIELADVGRAYGERVALAGVTVSLEAGQTLAVFGANGAGKTTLLRILATLLRPHRGTASVLGHALPREGWAVRGKIGFLGHDPLLYRDLTARETLQFPARLPITILSAFNHNVFAQPTTATVGVASLVTGPTLARSCH